uniref:Conserved oligomeric Golgi complex subunit 6 n=1 Tax=Strigamia maritima TaxID=126957 RepID=T1IZR2_STRMM
MASTREMEKSASDRQISSNPLSKKLNKILECRLENDKDTLEALKTLATYFTENNPRTRRDLRSQIERRSLVINEEFVQDFRQVIQQLDSVHKDVLAMSNCCREMSNRLQSTKTQTQDLISQTTQLKTDSQRLQMRHEIATEFLQTFQLQPEEVKSLRGTREGTIDDNFFAALKRVKQIHDDCKVLLRSNQQTAGRVLVLEIMESMALYQETAYERLYRWTQSESRLLTTDSLEISQILCQAVKHLQDRPVLFQYAIDEFTTARRAAVVRDFIDALTRGGGPGRSPRPIELHSHDPLRYVGDILAYLHQATASEKEHLEAFTKNCASSNELCDVIQKAISHIMEGVCRPLKMRVEQVIISESGAVNLYKLTNLLKFYHQTIEHVLTLVNSPLLANVNELHQLAHKMFFNSLNCHSGKLMENVELPPSDLGPTEAHRQTISLLRDVLACHGSSVTSLTDKQSDYAQILSCIIDPLLQMCTLSASKLTTTDMAAYMLNCIYLIHSMISLYEFTDQRLEMLQAQMDAHLDTLISEQAAFILSSTNLTLFYTTVQHHQEKFGRLMSIPGMEPQALTNAMVKFDSFLSGPDSLSLPQNGLLLSARLRQNLHQSAMQLIHSAYKVIYDTIHNPANGYTDPSTLMPRTPEQVQELLK